MATKRDLVEAHSFSRRRLVTAFVSGAPGGREVEPARPGRTIVGGVALSVLLIAGAAVTGVFSDRPASDWDSPGLVISKEQGAAYVILDEPEDGSLPELRPVINITSAQLILGAEGLEPRIVSQDTIETRPLGEDIGILNAPASLPTTDDLIDTGWTACTGLERGLAVEVSTTPGVTPTGEAEATLVEVKGPDAGLWLVATAPETATEPAQAYRYLLPDGSSDETDAFLREAGIGGGTSDAVRVPREWLDLFPRGGDLDTVSFGLDDLGRPAPGQPTGVRVGDHMPSTDGGVLVDDTGALQPLSAFAYALWRNLDVPGKQPKERTLEGSSATPVYAEARWPGTVLTRVAGQSCAQLESSSDAPPLVRLATSPVDEASADLVLDPASRLVTVDPGAGAYVVTGEWGAPPPETGGRRFVVDQKGRVNALVGEDTPTLLGYATYAAPVVPSSWLDLFSTGVALSQEAALCPPQPEGGAPSCA